MLTSVAIAQTCHKITGSPCTSKASSTAQGSPLSIVAGASSLEHRKPMRFIAWNTNMRAWNSNMRAGTIIVTRAKAILAQACAGEHRPRQFGHQIILTGIFRRCHGRQGELGHKDRLAARLCKCDALRSGARSPALQSMHPRQLSQRRQRQLGRQGFQACPSLPRLMFYASVL